MGLNDTPNAERLHIGIFGKRNAGKSSVMNALTGQDLAIVSDVKGTTTDPVAKAMELLPLGPVVLIDTPGLDDSGELGALRVQKSYQVLNRVDIALLVVEAAEGMTKEDMRFVEKLKEKKLPFLIVWNKSDLVPQEERSRLSVSENSIWVSTKEKENIHELKELIGAQLSDVHSPVQLVGDLIAPFDFILLVVPIDKAAPKGRLILPQQQTIRAILDAGAAAIVVKEHELKETLRNLGKKPNLVITDSQVFASVAEIVPGDVPLTSFSILFSRYKGELETAVQGVKAVDNLEAGDKVLISEGCTHHRQCDDIGTVKLPNWMTEHTGKSLQFAFSSGQTFPEDLSDYKMIVHCGGCTLNEREMKYRIRQAKDQGISMTNYGILIAYMQGILKRSIEIFPDIAEKL